jgi:hypothetical protein
MAERFGLCLRPLIQILILMASGLLKACDLLSRKQLVIAAKAIKHLSTSPQLIEVLQNSNAVETLVGLLGKMMKGAHGNVSSKSPCDEAMFQLTLAGNLLAHIPNYFLNVSLVESTTRRGSGVGHNPVVEASHYAEIAIKAICSTDIV